MQTGKHSKFKNTGILFELLTRQVTADILSGKDESDAKNLLFKFFNEGTELGKEWHLYNFLATEQLNNDIKADRAISIALKSREHLNNKKLAEEKYNLIKEIKQCYPIDKFLKSNVKNYRTYASIYKLFENDLSKEFNVKEIIQARNCLIENLINKTTVSIQSKDDNILEQYAKQSEDVRLLTYKMLVEKMNKKYKDFSDGQKAILREYINNVSNTNSLVEFITSEKANVKVALMELIKSVDNKVTNIKIQEVVHQIDKLNLSKGVKDNHIMVLLLAHSLINEIKKNI